MAPRLAGDGSREGRTEAAAARGPGGDGVEVQRRRGEERENGREGAVKKEIKRIRVGPAAGSWYRE